MLDLIFQAYFDCRRRKRRTSEALQFEEQYEKHCLRLHHEIRTGTYKPDNYQLIYVTDPVMREIFVPTFRDRVVHHLLANWLRPKLERIFIYDNYAGREGRGTLFGIRRAEKFMRQVTQNYQKPAYVLKLDIASYFRSIPKERLVSVILGQVNPFAEQGMNATRGSRWITTRSEQNRVCTFCAKSTKSIQGAKTRYEPSSSGSLLSSRSDSLPLKNPYLHSDILENSEEREREYLGIFSK